MCPAISGAGAPVYPVSPVGPTINAASVILYTNVNAPLGPVPAPSVSRI